MTHTDKRWIANSGAGFGVAYSEYGAIANWASHERADPDDETTVLVAQVEGECKMMPGSIRAIGDDAEMHETNAYRVDGATVNELAEISGRSEMTAEKLLVEGEEVDDSEA